MVLSLLVPHPKNKSHPHSLSTPSGLVLTAELSVNLLHQNCPYWRVGTMLLNLLMGVVYYGVQSTVTLAVILL